jgi:hypothetical protein
MRQGPSLDHTASDYAAAEGDRLPRSCCRRQPLSHPARIITSIEQHLESTQDLATVSLDLLFDPPIHGDFHDLLPRSHRFSRAPKRENKTAECMLLSATEWSVLTTVCSQDPEQVNMLNVTILPRLYLDSIII